MNQDCIPYKESFGYSKYKIVICSGFLNPVHSGHIDYLESAKKLGDRLIVIVNSDHQVKIKGSVPFMNEKERLRIVQALKPVDQAILSIDKDGTVCETLSSLHTLFLQDIMHNDFELIFANGGDRKLGNTPEEEFCKKVGIKTVYSIGGDKTQSSSEILKKVKNELYIQS